MPRDGVSRCTEAAFDFASLYTNLTNAGSQWASSKLTNKFTATAARTWDDTKWATEADKQFKNLKDAETAPTDVARRIRFDRYLGGAMEAVWNRRAQPASATTGASATGTTGPATGTTRTTIGTAGPPTGTAVTTTT
jgi:hypothetical protein